MQGWFSRKLMQLIMKFWMEVMMIIKTNKKQKEKLILIGVSLGISFPNFVEKSFNAI